MENRPPRKGKFPGLSDEQAKLKKRQKKRKDEDVDSEEDTEDTTDIEVEEEERKKLLRSRLSRKIKSLGKKESE